MEQGSLQRQAVIKRVLAGLPAAEDPEQLALLAQMEAGELVEVSWVLKHGQAGTVQEAIADLDERDAAIEEAYRRRAGFRGYRGAGRGPRQCVAKRSSMRLPSPSILSGAPAL